MNIYDQNKVDKRFEDLLQQCRNFGLHKLARHYQNFQGMQRVEAVRFLEALFTVRENNMRRIIRSYTIGIAVFAAVLFIYLIWIGVL